MRSLRLGVLCVCTALVCCCITCGRAKADTLNAYWNFNEAVGSTTAANSGNYTNVDGSLMGSAAFVSNGKFGNAVTLSGSTTTKDYVDVSNKVIADGGTTFTASAWVNAATVDGTRRTLFESVGTTTATGYTVSTELFTTNNYFTYSTETNSSPFTYSANTIIKPTVGTWYLVTEVVDISGDGKTHIYVDGALQSGADKTITGTLWSTVGFHIGSYRNADGRFFSGLIDDVAVWSNALSAGEVKATYDLGNSSTYGYDAGKVNQLIASYEGSHSDVTIGSVTWKYQGSGLGSTLGLSTDGNNLVLSTSGAGFTVIPEPSSFVLLVMGMFGLVAYAWRRRK